MNAIVDAPTEIDLFASPRDFSAKLRDLRIRVRETGVRRTFDYLWQRGITEFHERQLGINTTSAVRLAQPGCGTFEHNHYVPIGYGCLSRLLRRLRFGKGNEVVLDYGSGLGRLALVAATHSIQKAIGVEGSEDLTQRAKTNLDGIRYRLRCHDVQFIAMDATQYEVPDDVNTVFFVNPFNGEARQAVYRKLLESLDRASRPMTVICVNPNAEAFRLFKQGTRFTVRREYDDYFSPGVLGKILILDAVLAR
jgi:predicted RNA methylase